MSVPTFRCQGVTKVFGGRTDDVLAMVERGASRSEILTATGSTLAVHDIDLQVEPGELFVIMGLSGSGKSTFVRLLNRLIEPTLGTIELDGEDLRSADPRRLREIRNRKVSMVFQHFGLLPHHSVLENAAYGLKLRGESNAKCRERAGWALEAVGLSQYAKARPSALSGGMRQRVGLARALATDANVMLMDEPFSALDPLIRRDMQELVLRLKEDLKKTVVFITHDLNEAMKLGDRILMLRDGKSVQIGSGAEILAAPADDYVADFVADVDRTRVLTASDIAREPKLVARLTDAPAGILTRLSANEANGVFILDDADRLLGVALDGVLADIIREGRTLHAADLVTNLPSVSPECPISDVLHLVGRHAVPLAIVSDDRKLVGVLPRAAVLQAIANRPAGG